MNIDILYENEKEKNATEKVLASFKVKRINESIDSLISEILKYAIEIDNLLAENGYAKRYLEKASNLSSENTLALDEDLETLDFRIKEIILDKIKRINTRFNMIGESDLKLKELEQKYDLNNINLDEMIKLSNLANDVA